jgi:uncharacterized membrane protein YdcZ (DUF606 family)
MKRITPFTLLYIAVGVLLTVIALQQSDIPPNTTLAAWMFSGLAYLVAFLSTFPFWQQDILRRQKRLRLQPVWQQVCWKLLAGIVVAAVVFSPLFDVPTKGWSVETTVQLCLKLPLIVFSAEQLFVSSQIK